MKKTLLALLAVFILSAPAFAASEDQGVGYTTQSIETLLDGYSHHYPIQYGSVCRNGAYWCSMNYPAPVGAVCNCIFPTWWFQGWVTVW